MIISIEIPIVTFNISIICNYVFYIFLFTEYALSFIQSIYYIMLDKVYNK